MTVDKEKSALDYKLESIGGGAQTATILQQSGNVVRLPGLHERPARHMLGVLLDCDAKIINFPVSGWQRNAAKRR